MKRIITLCVFVLGSLMVGAQCVPNTSITSPGYYPDSATGLPHAVVGTPYSTDIQVLIPATYQIYTVDSVILVSITGLPPGFTYSCTPSSCRLLPNVNGCVLISGPALPGSAAGSTFPLTINVTAYLKLAGFPLGGQAQSITFYNIVVDQSSGIAALSKSHFDVAQNFPNPFSDKTSFAFSSSGNENVSVKIYNLLGSQVYSKSIFSRQGINFLALEARDFSPGIYMVNMSNGKATVTRRMIVVKNQ
jgi:hypothetical protein